MRAASKVEHPSYRAWKWSRPLRRILIIRLHAFGDIAATLPACHALKRMFPHVSIDFLTGAGAGSLPDATAMFDRVIETPILLSRWERATKAGQLGLQLRHSNYDLVLDLQSNWFTRCIRRILMPSAWSEFSRYGETPAAVRTLEAFRACGFRSLVSSDGVPIRHDLLRAARDLLSARGWDGDSRIVILNPAGAWGSRHWPEANYLTLAREWRAREPATFVFVGTDRISTFAGRFRRAQPETTIDLSGQTSVGEAMGILRFASVVLTEDSGLAHMSSALGVPTVTLLGSSKFSRSAPVGVLTTVLDSRDLACGECMEPNCRFGDVHCLSRHSAAEILSRAHKIALAAPYGVDQWQSA